MLKNFSHIKFQTPTNNVYFTSRPDVYEKESVLQFIETEKPDIRIQLTDDMLEWIPDLPFHWHTWIPGKNIPIEQVWNVLNLLHYYREKTVWMHCDSSTMRAPTFFGLYLLAFHKDQAMEISEKAKWSDERYNPTPLRYAQTSINLDPGIKELIENWQISTKDAYIFLMRYQNRISI